MNSFENNGYSELTAVCLKQQLSSSGNVMYVTLYATDEVMSSFTKIYSLAMKNDNRSVIHTIDISSYASSVSHYIIGAYNNTSPSNTTYEMSSVWGFK